MSSLRVGTRGSDLALWQTRTVVQGLRRHFPDLEIEEVVIKTYAETAPQHPLGKTWPAGGFVGAIEEALISGSIDFGVHSYKDLPSAQREELTIAAVPERGLAHDVLLTKRPVALDALPDDFRIGTSSPRRSAQFKRIARVQIIPIRGNVPTRVRKLDGDTYDGVCLAAAGLERLGIQTPHRIDLPVERFVPAPAQGALAVQVRRDNPACERLAVLDHAPTRRVVLAERTFLSVVSAGCHTPVAALAALKDGVVELHARLFSDDEQHMVEGRENGADPVEVGAQLGCRLRDELRTQR